MTLNKATLMTIMAHPDDAELFAGGTLAIDGDSIADSGKLTIDGGIVSVTNTETVNTLY